MRDKRTPKDVCGEAMTDVDRLDLLAQELGFVLKKNGAEGCFGVAPQGKGCFLCPTNGRLPFLSRLCKKEGSVNNTRLLPHAKMLLVPMNFFPCQVDYALEETF